MTISVIGHGYVGLVTAAVFANLGNKVWCIGRTKEKIEQLKNGEIPFYEPGLEELVRKNLTAGRLKFTLSYEEAIPLSTIIFICVGTPPLKNGEADLSQVFAAAKAIALNLKGDKKVVVVKSTVPVGTTNKVAEIIKRESQNPSSFEIAFVPEFLREGTAIQDTLHPDRIVLGTNSSFAKNLLIELHRPISGKLILADIVSAEIIKYASNALLATKISFSNLIAFLCEKVGADAELVLEGVGQDRRLGRSFLYPGVGYGGSCLPKDVKALIKVYKKSGIDPCLFEDVEKINILARDNFIKKAIEALKGITREVKVGILGLSFKPNTDDMREAPSIKIIESLQKKGIKIKAYDPVAMPLAKTILKDVEYCKNPYKVAENVDVLLIITEWDEFKKLNLSKIKKLMRRSIIIDGRNIFDPERIKKLGFYYQGVGRK